MGGSAFASGPDALCTPRMPPAVYHAVRARCQAVLRRLFVAVATPLDGPGKADFGDVDIVVALPQADAPTQDGVAGLLAAAAAALGAVRTLADMRETKASMAIPWPQDAAAPPGPQRDTRPLYVQVDLAVAPSLPRFHWRLFRHAHGDFWNILGTAVLRPLGLTIDERALWLRVPEIEQAHRARARVFLTDEPAAVLHFLGLAILAAGGGSLWERPFATADDAFAYVTTCRFFAVHGDGRQRASDRRRIAVRPLFRQWVTEFVPAYRASLSSQTKPTDRLPITRDAVRDAAFAAFPGTEPCFAATRAAWLREHHLLAVRSAAKDAVPADLPGTFRGPVWGAVRRHLGLVMDTPGSDGAPSPAETAAAAWSAEGVAAYVAAHWQAIAEAALPVETARYVASLE